MSLKALVFDLDGTLADTDPLHRQAFADYLAPFGIEVTETFYQTKVSGRSNSDIFRDLFPSRTPAELGRMADEKEARFRALATELRPAEGLLDLIRWAKSRDFRLAVVTNAPRANLQHMLEVLGLGETFDTLILSDELARGKPDPLPYLTALDRLSVRPDEAIAFEDSSPGIRSAVGAGIKTVGLVTGNPAADLLQAGASFVVNDFRDPSLWAVLESMLGQGTPAS